MDHTQQVGGQKNDWRQLSMPLIRRMGFWPNGPWMRNARKRSWTFWWGQQPPPAIWFPHICRLTNGKKAVSPLIFWRVHGGCLGLCPSIASHHSEGSWRWPLLGRRTSYAIMWPSLRMIHAKSVHQPNPSFAQVFRSGTGLSTTRKSWRQWKQKSPSTSRTTRQRQLRWMHAFTKPSCQGWVDGFVGEFVHFVGTSLTSCGSFNFLIYINFWQVVDFLCSREHSAHLTIPPR